MGIRGLSGNDEDKKKDTKQTSSTNSTTSSSSSNSSSTVQTYSSNKGSSVFSEQISTLTKKAEDKNKEDSASIHGLSDEEYLGLRDTMAQYGIEYETLRYGGFDNVAKTAAKQIGKAWCYDMIAESYDSVLDLVLDEKLNNALQSYGIGKDGRDWNWQTVMKYADRLRKDYGIVIQNTSNRNYWVSLVDENGNVIQDADGHLAQVKKTDCILPDGSGQDVEKFASALIDQMGYDCVSILDLTPEEYEMVKKMAALDVKNTDLGTSSDKKVGGYSGNYSGTQKSTADWQNNRKGYFANSGYSGGAHGVSGSNVKGLGGETGAISKNGEFISQADFDKQVEKYLEEGYSKFYAENAANSANGTHLSYTGNKETVKKADDISQKDFNDKVDFYISKGYDLKKATSLAKGDLDVNSFKYTGENKPKDEISQTRFNDEVDDLITMGYNVDKAVENIKLKFDIEDMEYTGSKK